MAILARIKSFAGTGRALPVLDQVATPAISTQHSVFTVTGTTAITGFDTSTATPILPGRLIVLMGTHATGPAFTDTAVASSAEGKIHLSAALTLAKGTTVTFVQADNGSWWEVARAANG